MSKLFISGYSLKAPRSNNPYDFYKNLDSQNLMTTTDTRWPKGYKNLPPMAGIIDTKEIENFDYTYFKMSPTQAKEADPVLKLCLELTHEALMDSNIDILKDFRGSNTGVYIGHPFSDHTGESSKKYKKNGYELVCGANCMVANRISFYYDLKGPSYTLDTACSSSLVALNCAVSDLKAGKIDRAVVGGVSLCLDINKYECFNSFKMLSPDGRCYSFDERANGYCRSDGLAIIIIEKDNLISEKMAYAEIASTGVNSDGFTPNGITVPNPEAQHILQEQTLKDANLNYTDIKYIEAHGTGTIIGDDLELSSLKKTFKDHKCPIGSLKSIMGHAEGASGILSLIKVLMSFEKKKLFANYDFRSTKHKHLQDNSLWVVSENTTWETGPVMINNFGFGGTNACCILNPVNTEFNTKPEKTTLTFGQDLLDDASYWINNQIKSGNELGFDEHTKFTNKDLVILFGGQGNQWKEMGKVFMEDTNSEFYKTIERLSTFLTEYDENAPNLLELYLDGSKWLQGDKSTVGIISYEIALYNTLKKTLYIDTNKLKFIGHSLGETTCAYTSGCCSERECIISAYIRSSLTRLRKSKKIVYSTCDDNEAHKIFDLYLKVVDKDNTEYKDFDLHGMMAVVGLTVDELNKLFDETNIHTLTIACQNSPSGQTLSGDEKSMEKFYNVLKEKYGDKLFWRNLNTDGIAYHSPYLKLFIDVIKRDIDDLLTSTPEIPENWLSTSKNTDKYYSSEYICNNIIRPVYLYQQIQKLNPNSIVVEVGSSSGLLSQLKRTRDDLTLIPLVVHSQPSSEEKVKNITDFSEFLWRRGLTGLYKTDERPSKLELSKRYGMVPWDHSDKIKPYDFEHYKNRQFSENSSSSSNQIDYDQQELQEHKILGNPIVPATLYIDMIIKNLLTDENKNSIKNITIKDLQILSMVPVVKENSFNVNHTTDGFVEITNNSKVVAKARKVVVNSQYQTTDVDYLENFENSIDSGSLYSELRRVGYCWEESYQLLDKMKDNNFLLNGTQNFTAHLDNLLHCIISNNIIYDNLRLPTMIGSVSVNTDSLEKSKDTCYCKLLNNTLYCSSGIKLSDLNTNVAGPRKTDSLVHTKEINVEYGAEVENNDKLLLYTFFKVCSENNNNNIKVSASQDVIDRYSKYSLYFPYASIVFNVSENDISFSCDNQTLCIITDQHYDKPIICKYKDTKVYDLQEPDEMIEVKTLDDIKIKNMNTSSKYLIVGDGSHGFVKSTGYENIFLHSKAQKILDDSKAIVNTNLPKYSCVKNNRLYFTVMVPFEKHETITNYNKHLEIKAPGDLDSLVWKTHGTKNPDNMVDVKFVALNFKDVMYSFGKLKLDKPSFGFEFSGIESKTNRGVMCIGNSGSIADKIEPVLKFYTDELDMSLCDAATIPVVYLTAGYALIYKSAIQKGDKVLIHSGSGGVGQAAINICKSYECEIFITCSPLKAEKMHTKYNIPYDHIFSSRDESFYDKLMLATDGVGCDVILNSLSDELLHTSLKCMAPYGNFCEIGKYDITSNTKIGLKSLESNVSYHVIDLSYMFSSKKYSTVLSDIMNTMIKKQNILKPLEHEIYSIVDIKDALRFLGNGNHKGKVLLDMKDIDKTDISTEGLQFSGKHVVFGGTSGFGLELAFWLSKHGASEVRICSRSGIKNIFENEKFEKRIADGYNIKVDKLDITDKDKVKEFMNKNLKLSGIWHTSMVLRDGLYENLSEEDWHTVLRPKIDGLNNILENMSDSLEYAITFSSISSLYGNIGQTSYAWANNACENIITKFNSKTTKAIQWGAIDNVGVVIRNKMKDVGNFVPQNVDDSLQSLEYLLTTDDKVVSSFLLKKEEKVEMIKEENILSEVIKKIKEILKLDKVDQNSVLKDLGMDSMNTIEFISWANKNIEKSQLSPPDISETTTCISISEKIGYKK